MPTFYGPPSDGTVIPEQLETALAADVRAADSAIGAAVGGAAAKTNRPGEMGATLGNVIASRAKLATDQPTVVTTTTQPIASGVRVAHDVSGVNADVRFLGGYPVNPGDASGNRVRNGIGQEAPYSIEFNHTGSDLAVEGRNMSGTPALRIWVDGEPTTRTHVAPEITVAAGGAYYVRLTFPLVRQRRIRVDLHNTDLRGVWKTTEATITPSTYVTAPSKVAFLGDSWTHGAAGVGPMNTFAWESGRILGVDAAQAGEGGTGYTVGGIGSRTPFGSTARLDRITPYAPGHLVVFGTINDHSSTPAAVQAAAAQLYADVATRLPSTKIIVFGVQPRNSNVPAVDLANRDAIKAAAAAAANVVAFVDPIAERIFTGTGNYSAPKGDGNADYVLSSDGVHPTLIGHEYLSRWVAAHLALRIS